MINQIKKNQRGFSLVEMAIVLAIVGSLIGASVSLYGNYMVSQKTQKTEESIANLSEALGAFRSIYGRYPCPSTLTATKGDLEYGHENQNCKTENYGASGSCTDGICSATSANADASTIVIGTLPFKAMGLEESAIYDSYGNKLTYAVTAPLTSRNTFDMTKGGIGLLDKAGVSVVTPENSAHFVIVSHGKNGLGGYTMGGQENDSCTTAAADEKENCNDDESFVFGSPEAEFDDRVVYFTPIGVSYWQKETTTSNDIFLRDADSIAIGVSATEDLATVGSTGIKKKNADSGVVWAQNSSFLSGFLCEYDVTNPSNDCFKSSVIGGKIAEGEGLDCGSKFMVGLKNGKPQCEDEVYVSCPDGSFVAGIDENGKLICDSLTEPHCKTQQIESSCGTEEKVAYAEEGQYSTTLSGTCYMFKDADNLTSDDWKEFVGYNQQYGNEKTYLENRIQKLNAEKRDVVECNTLKGFDGTGGIVRDTYLCEKNEWKHEVAHERGNFYNSFSLDVTDQFGMHDAEIGGASYSTSEDPNHKADTHDCWCREDWKVEYESCGEGFNPSGMIRHISKHRCPSTKASWELVWSDYSQCQACVPGGTIAEEVSCSDYLGISQDDPLWGGLQGTVSVSWPAICENGLKVKDSSAKPEYGSTAACHCPAKASTMDITYCPVGTTNSYNLPEEKTPRKGIQSIKIDQWICPGNDPKNGIPQPGYWEYDSSPSDIPPCVCDPDLFEYEYEACGGNSQGKTYKKKWDCKTNAWQEQKEWELISDECDLCSWAPGPEYDHAELVSPVIGTACTCGDTSTPYCNDGEGGMFEKCECRLDNTWIKK